MVKAEEANETRGFPLKAGNLVSVHANFNLIPSHHHTPYERTGPDIAPGARYQTARCLKAGESSLEALLAGREDHCSASPRGPLQNSLPVPKMASPTTSAPAARPTYKVDSFNPAVLAHLRRIYESLQSQGQTPTGPDGATLSASAHFLQDIQKDQHLEADQPRSGQQHGVLDSFSSFLEYMSTASAMPQFSDTQAYEEDLSFPMPNYFINSSHNTYLTGNQLYSESSTEVYKNVCGCICFNDSFWPLPVSHSVSSSSPNHHSFIVFFLFLGFYSASIWSMLPIRLPI